MQEGAASLPEQTSPVLGEFRPGKPLASLLSTTRDVLLSPRRFFDGLPPDGPSWPPVLYVLTCYLITTLINLIATVPFLIVPALIAMTDESPEADFYLIFLLVFVFALLIALPILSVVLFFAGVAIQHVFVFLVARRVQRGLRATLRVSCYAVGAPVLVAWVPVVGFLAVFYCFYLYTTGLKRVHGISTARALAAVLIPAMLFVALMAAGIFLGYKAVQAAQDPVSYEVPPPETSEELPQGVVGAKALMDGSEDQAQVRELRDASYSDRIPRALSGRMTTVVTADPKGEPRGVRGFARGAGGETVRIDPEHPANDREGTDHITYYADEGESRSPRNYYADPITQQILIQQFALGGSGSYTINLEQVGEEPRIIMVRTYSDHDTYESVAYFQVPYRVTEPGAKLRLEVVPGVLLDELRLKIDRNGDDTYEESWIPEATIVGTGANDGAPPVTKATLKEDPMGREPFLILDARDRGHPDEDVPPSGVGITYYWINDSGPRIYTEPVPVETGDVITYWSIDRAGNVEWRRTTDVRQRPRTLQASTPELPTDPS